MNEATTPTPVAEACAFWQAGRDGGSSLLRGAARVITGVPHYFSADFITAYEQSARERPRALQHANVLLGELATSPVLTPSLWALRNGVTDQDFAGRGLAADPSKDDQIEARLSSGSIVMPLWGVTLDREVTERYGSRFLLEIIGAFPAIPAWTHSAIKADEQELITGGTYGVAATTRLPGKTHVQLRWIPPCNPVPDQVSRPSAKSQQTRLKH